MQSNEQCWLTKANTYVTHMPGIYKQHVVCTYTYVYEIERNELPMTQILKACKLFMKQPRNNHID